MPSPEPLWVTLPHEVAAIWHSQRAPLASLAAGTGLLGLARLTGIRWMALIGPGVALIVGWGAVAGAAPTAPTTIASLPVIALLALALGVVATAARWRHAGSTAIALLAVLASWLLAGGPRGPAAVLAELPSIATAGVLFAVTAACLRPSANRWAPLAAASGLRLALGLANAPPETLAIAAVGIAVSLIALTQRWSRLTAVPILCALAAAAAAIAIDQGRLVHGGLSAIDVAAGTPVMVLWLTPRLAPGLPVGRDAVAALAAALIGSVITSGLVSIAHVR